MTSTDPNQPAPPVAATINDHLAHLAQHNAQRRAREQALIAEQEAAGHRIVTDCSRGAQDADQWEYRDYRTGEILISFLGTSEDCVRRVDELDPDGKWLLVDNVEDWAFDELRPHEPVLRIPGVPDDLCDEIGQAIQEWAADR